MRIKSVGVNRSALSTPRLIMVQSFRLRYCFLMPRIGSQKMKDSTTTKTKGYGLKTTAGNELKFKVLQHRPY